jgi:hypothetical protein
MLLITCPLVEFYHSAHEKLSIALLESAWKFSLVMREIFEGQISDELVWEKNLHRNSDKHCLINR